ncbi:hypothetical protein Tco_0703752 [Tanacetum coccineum]|uniref:Uncharacterized protein n=1 Tax=Tanacetum coccineum TaxID=301880 RepID=A0ABQ4Y0L3_9ASTR
MEQMATLCDMVGASYTIESEKKANWRKNKRLKINIGRFPFAMMMTMTIPLQSHLSVENLVQIPSESEGIPDSVCDVPLCNNPTPLEACQNRHYRDYHRFNDDFTSSDVDSCMRTSIMSLHHLPDAQDQSETFCFDLEENSSGSTTTRSDYSLPDYEAFYSDDDHIGEKSSGSTTTHADFSNI